MLANFLNTALAVGIVALQIGIVALIIGWIAKAPFVSLVAKRVDVILPVLFIGAAVGSLIYEHILLYPPCILCWYQRLAIFPIAFFSATGSVLKSALLRLQLLIVALYGFAIALFHNYLDIFQPAGITVCGADGVSCAARYVYEFGYITIPMMSGTVLLAGILLILLARRYPQNAVVA